jgi:hypothetical protein
VNAIPSVNTSSATPVSQLASRGNLNAPVRKTWIMWAKIKTTIAEAPK